MKIKAVLAAITVLALSLSQNTLAHLKTDIVTLYNGDRVTGELKSLYAGRLQHKTDSMGTINIEWQEIASIKSVYHYEVRISDGRRLFGSIGEGERPGMLLVKNDEGEHELEWLQVVELRQVEDTLRDRINIYLAAGYSYTKAGSVRQTSLVTEVGYEGEDNSTSLSGRTIITDTDSQEESLNNRYEVSRRLWKERARFFRTFGAGYEDNDELNLDHRINVGAGRGRYFIDTHRMRLLGSAGLQLITERFEGETEQQDVEFFLSTDFATWRFSTPELDLGLRINLYPSLTDSGRIRSDTDVNIRWEIVDDLYFDLTFWSTTDNQAESDRQVDYGLTTGLGWDF